jgi:hypothetical protein
MDMSNIWLLQSYQTLLTEHESAETLLEPSKVTPVMSLFLSAGLLEKFSHPYSSLELAMSSKCGSME